MVSGVDVTMEVSVVGKLPGAGLTLAAGAADAAGAVVDETTDVSSVANRRGALAAGAGEFSVPAIGAGSGFSGRPDSPVRFAFCKAVC